MDRKIFDRSNVRFILGSAILAGNDVIGVVKPLSSRELRQITYSHGSYINLDNDMLHEQVTIEVAAEKIVSKTIEAANTGEITIQCEETILRNGITTWLRNRVFKAKTTMTLKSVYDALRDIGVKEFGAWQGWNVETTRFIAAVAKVAFGQSWINQNFAVYGKPESAIGIYTYERKDISVDGDKMSMTTIALANPATVAVIGLYPLVNGVRPSRFVGELPAQAMIDSKVKGLPAAIPLNGNTASLKAIANLLKVGSGDMNKVFKSPNGGYFVFTDETLEMMRGNPDVFIAQLSVAIAYTDGNMRLVNERKTAYAAFATTRNAFLDSLTCEIVTSTTAQKHSNVERTPFVGTPARELVTAGIGSSNYGDSDFNSNA